MKKKQILITLLTLAVSTGLIAAGLIYKERNPEYKQNIEEMKVLDELKMETAKDVSASLEESLNSFDMKTLIATLDSNIQSIDNVEQRDALVSELLNHTITYIRGDLQLNQLLNHIREYKMTPSNMGQKINNLDNEEVKFLYGKMKEGFVTVKLGYNESYIGENFLTDMVPDYDAILGKYREYISNEFADYLMYKKAYTENISKTSISGLDYDALLSNIEASENFLKNHSESKYADEVNLGLAYNYQSFFGYYPYTRVFSTFNHEVSSEAVKQFEEAAESETKLGEKSEKMLEALDHSGHKMTPEVLKTIEDIGEVTKDTFFYYWYEVLELENPFGEDLYDMTTDGITYVIDPDTGEKIGILDNETGEILPLDDVYEDDSVKTDTEEEMEP